MEAERKLRERILHRSTRLENTENTKSSVTGVSSHSKVATEKYYDRLARARKKASFKKACKLRACSYRAIKQNKGNAGPQGPEAEG